MINLPAPAQSALETYTACISRVQDPILRQRLVDATQAVVDASREFAQAAAGKRLHRIAQHTHVAEVVTRDEMEAVYTQRMARKGAPGRPIYDALLSSAPQGKCPLCVHRNVSTLDHHLPKAHYPSLAVAPLNLIPACPECNKSKLAAVPTAAEEAPLHPYFDEIDQDRWLHATVIEEEPAALRFFVQGPPTWGAVLTARVERHFRALRLGALYATEAADELLSIRHQLHDINARGGPALVRQELVDRAESCRGARRNGWRTATFDAFAASDWFCGGGFS
jgi:5-methylcytosine-specific restriction endonuclease McrA